MCKTRSKSPYTMAAQPPSSQFWLNFGSLKRKKKDGGSPWNKFHTPYDFDITGLVMDDNPSSGVTISESTYETCPSEELTPSVLTLLPPPRGRQRKSSKPRAAPRSLSCPRKRETRKSPPPRVDTLMGCKKGLITPDPHSDDAHKVPRSPDNKAFKMFSSIDGRYDKKVSMSTKREDPWKPIILKGNLGLEHLLSCQNSTDSTFSQSTEDLEMVRDRWLQELESYRVDASLYKSQESLNVRIENLMIRAGSVVSLKKNSNVFSNLKRTIASFHKSPKANSKNALQTNQPKKEAGESAPNKTVKENMTNLKDCLQSPKVTKPIRMPRAKDSQITVKPGVRLPRSRSCESNLRDRIRASPNKHETEILNSALKSKSVGLESPRNSSKILYHGSLKRCPRPKPRSFSCSEDMERDDIVMDNIPQVPELKFNKYNFRKGRSSKNSMPKELLTPSKVNLELALMQQQRGSWEGQESTEHAKHNNPQEDNGGDSSLPSKLSRSGLFKSAFGLRSKSVDHHLSRIPKTNLNSQEWEYRRSADAAVPLSPQVKRVVCEEENGRYRGVIFDGTSSARTGTFPPSLVHRDVQVGGMSGRGKPVAAVKVSPPTVPDAALSHRHSGSSFSSGVYSASGDQRSSYSSSISDDNPPPSPRSPARVNCDHGQLGRVSTNNANNINNNNSNNNGQHGTNSPSHYHNNQQFTFPNNHQGGVPQFAHLMCPKTSPGSPHHVPPDSTYNYLTYQQQTSLEDQGIDVQSPGRSSPGSGSGSSTTGSTASSGGCRNSTTSLDSGRASTSTHTHQHRLSGQSYDSGSILRHSYHSSSSSLGSMEHDGTPHVNVPELLNNGVRDSEVLRAWLTDIRSDEYYDKFMLAGYDMPTICRMTPEDLNAIGITKPAHRKKLKAEITKLNISDRLPNFIPGRLEDWLSILRLEEYTTSLKQQGYTSVEQMTQITWEDLEDIGITKLGHQKKVMLAIKRVKDIMAGKKFSNPPDTRPQNQYTTHEIMISRDGGDARDQFTGVPEFRTFAGHPVDHNRLSGPADPGGHYGVPNHYAPGVQYGPMGPPQAHVQPMPHQQGPYISSGQFGGSQGPSPPGGKVHGGPAHPLPGPGQVQYRPDVVAVQVRPGGRGRSAESLDEPIYGTYQTFHPDNRLSHSQGPSSLGSLPPRPFPPPSMVQSHPQRSMDDGDITPTNEFAGTYEGGGTLPRPRTANKLRPVAKVTAKTRADVHEIPQFIKDGMNAKKPQQQVEEIGMKELNIKSLNRQNSEKIYSSSQGSGSTNNTPQGTPKKMPPPPPRRSNSISESSKEAALRDSNQHGYLRRGLSYGYMGIKNNLQPDVTPDLPPPPAPPDSANHQHHPDDFPPPPPPLTCITMASSSRITSTITTSSITSDSLSTSQTSTSSAEDVAAGFRPRRNDSNASFKSTSSTDSDSLPFANENAGTIKQRACRPHPGLSVLDTRNSPHSSPRSSPALRRKDAQPPLRQNPIANTEASTETTATAESGSPDGTGDVLNDIGNMLANLTDELDAMLEQELVLKN